MENVILPLHLLTLAFVVWTVVHADRFGFDWMRGTREKLDAKIIKKLHRNTWVGLAGMITTGLFLFFPMREYLLARPQFYLKMAFVLTLIINGFVIGKLQSVATTKAVRDLTFTEKLPLFISGAVSTLGWVGAALTALFLVQD
ncbi:MAG: hypothetical protein RIQ41_234 [Candidatus Parcubacteria bacterium]|jgi:hypothetical protein